MRKSIFDNLFSIENILVACTNRIISKCPYLAHAWAKQPHNMYTRLHKINVAHDTTTMEGLERGRQQKRLNRVAVQWDRYFRPTGDLIDSTAQVGRWNGARRSCKVPVIVQVLYLNRGSTEHPKNNTTIDTLGQQRNRYSKWGIILRLLAPPRVYPSSAHQTELVNWLAGWPES